MQTGPLPSIFFSPRRREGKCGDKPLSGTSPDGETETGSPTVTWLWRSRLRHDFSCTGVAVVFSRHGLRNCFTFFFFFFFFSSFFFFSPHPPFPPPQSIDAACGESSAFFLLDFCHSNSFRLFSPCRRPCRILVNRLASERERGNGRRGGCCTSGFICGRAWLSQRESEECFRGAGCRRYSTLALPLPCASSPSAEFSVSPFPRLIFSYSNRKE